MYHECFLPEHKNNPLIEALPPLVDDLEIIKRLRYGQQCNPEERTHPDFIRKKYLHRIDQFTEPTYEYVTCFRAIEDLITESYVPKNPFLNTTRHWLHYDEPGKTRYVPSNGLFVPRAVSMAVIGDGGAGKSWMLENILRYFPQTIQHKRYQGKPLKLDQVVWIKVNCTENANVSALLILILEELDRLTGSDDARRALTARDRIAHASLSISRKLKALFVGILVIDEIQHLKFADKKQKAIFIQFLLNTMARAGVPVVFGGDPRLKELMTEELPVSRRVESGGFISMRGYTEHEWELFFSHLWRYQWTNPVTPPSQELSDCLRVLSTGLPDFAIKTFKAAQKLVIGSGNETLSPAILKQAHFETCVLSEAHLAERRKANNPVRDEKVEANAPRPGDIKKKTKKKPKSTWDVNRVQHDEFESRIAKVRELNFASQDFIWNVLRKASEFPDPMESLEKSKILLRHSKTLSF
ncbi:AAA family ATPase [Cellvibrio sp. UBA7661]|uniref:AAA family ATPase n=1 Tax=Cellvibrio sp. UBA7661 TaxID=1946311 RepID=UPI002F360487